MVKTTLNFTFKFSSKFERKSSLCCSHVYNGKNKAMSYDEETTEYGRKNKEMLLRMLRLGERQIMPKWRRAVRMPSSSTDVVV